MRKFPLKRKVLHLTLAVMLLTFSVPRAAFSQALSTTTHSFVPLDQSIDVPCANGGAGELVLISGTLHILDHVTVVSDGINTNHLILKMATKPLGATGLGLTTGDVYQVTGLTQFMDMFAIPNGAHTFINNFRLIAPGPNNNLLAHFDVHRTINANGEVTSEVSNIRIDCN